MSKIITTRLDSETLAKIEYIKIWMTNNLPFNTKWTTTDVVKLSIVAQYEKIKSEL